MTQPATSTELQSLAQLTRVEGTNRVAEATGLTEQIIHRLRSGHISNAAFSTVNVFCRLATTWEDVSDEDIEDLLMVSVEQTPNVNLQQLADVKRAYPTLDLVKTLFDMVEGRERRANRTEPETRGRKAS